MASLAPVVPILKICTDESGNTYEDSQNFTKWNKNLTRPGACPSQSITYDIKQDQLCSNGSMTNQGPPTEANTKVVGDCSCSGKPDGSVWSVRTAEYRTESDPACTYGGKVRHFRLDESYSCSAGNIVVGDRIESLDSVSGNCNCSGHIHGEAWSEAYTTSCAASCAGKTCTQAGSKSFVCSTGNVNLTSDVLGLKSDIGICTTACIGSWSACSPVDGKETYTITQPAVNGGVACEAANGATRINSSCPLLRNCVGSWGACSNGQKTYTVSQPAANGGAACEANTGDVSSVGCPQPVNCVGDWGVCSPADGKQIYTITQPAANGGASCEAATGDVRVNASCPLLQDCVGSWGSCSNGIKSYTVTQPAANGGNQCSNATGDTSSAGCPQPVNCEGSWGSCSNGIKSYTVTQSAANGGNQCSNATGDTSSVDCPQPDCTIRDIYNYGSKCEPGRRKATGGSRYIEKGDGVHSACGADGPTQSVPDLSDYNVTEVTRSVYLQVLGDQTLTLNIKVR